MIEYVRMRLQGRKEWTKGMQWSSDNGCSTGHQCMVMIVSVKCTHLRKRALPPASSLQHPACTLALVASHFPPAAAAEAQPERFRKLRGVPGLVSEDSESVVIPSTLARPIALLLSLCHTTQISPHPGRSTVE
jgi:hypothetical protein